MAIRVNLEPIKRLQEFLKVIGGRYSLAIDGLTGPSETKLEYGLIRRARPMLAVTQQMRAAMLREWKASIGRLLSQRGNAINLDPALELMSKAAKIVVMRRFEEGGYDVNLRPLTAKYAAWKHAHNLDPRIGIARGILLRNLRRARFVMRKTSGR